MIGRRFKVWRPLDDPDEPLGWKGGARDVIVAPDLFVDGTEEQLIAAYVTIAKALEHDFHVLTFVAPESLWLHQSERVAEEVGRRSGGAWVPGADGRFTFPPNLKVVHLGGVR